MYVLCTRNFDWILTLLCWDVPLEQFVKDHNIFQLRKYAFYIYTSTSIPFQYMMKIKENQTHAKILYLANIRHTANSKTSTKYRLQFCTSYMQINFSQAKKYASVLAVKCILTLNDWVRLLLVHVIMERLLSESRNLDSEFL